MGLWHTTRRTSTQAAAVQVIHVHPLQAINLHALCHVARMVQALVVGEWVSRGLQEWLLATP